MPSEVTEVEVIVTEEPSSQESQEHKETQPPSLEILVGELKAKVEGLENQIVTLTQKDNQLEILVEEVGQIQRWNREEIEEIASSLFSQMNQIETSLQQIESDDSTENESESSADEIPVVPEQVEQQEPEEVAETKSRRPWFL